MGKIHFLPNFPHMDKSTEFYLNISFGTLYASILSEQSSISLLNTTHIT